MSWAWSLDLAKWIFFIQVCPTNYKSQKSTKLSIYHFPDILALWLNAKINYTSFLDNAIDEINIYYSHTL